MRSDCEFNVELLALWELTLEFNAICYLSLVIGHWSLVIYKKAHTQSSVFRFLFPLQSAATAATTSSAFSETFSRTSSST